MSLLWTWDVPYAWCMVVLLEKKMPGVIMIVKVVLWLMSKRCVRR